MFGHLGCCAVVTVKCMSCYGWCCGVWRVACGVWVCVRCVWRVAWGQITNYDYAKIAALLECEGYLTDLTTNSTFTTAVYCGT